MENMIRNNNLKIILEFFHCLFLGELSDRKTNFLDILFALKKLYTRPNLSIFTANQTRAVFMVVLFRSCYEKIHLMRRPSFYRFFSQQVSVGGRNKNKNKIHSDHFPIEIKSKETQLCFLRF